MATFAAGFADRSQSTQDFAGWALPIPLGPGAGLKWMLSEGGLLAWLGVADTAMTDLVLRYLRQGDVFWDVGARGGFHSLMAARRVGPAGHVYAFESGTERETLMRHKEINRVENMTLVPAGIPALDEWFETRLPAAPTLLRIAEPGQESRILRGAVRLLDRARPGVVVRCHGWRDVPPIASYSACRAILAGAGYRVTAEFPDNLRDPILVVGNTR